MVFDVVNLTSCCSSKVNVWTTALALDLWNTGDKTIRDQELRPSFSRAFFFAVFLSPRGLIGYFMLGSEYFEIR